MLINRRTVSLISAVGAALFANHAAFAANSYSSTWTQTYSNVQMTSDINSSLSVYWHTVTNTYNGDGTQTQTVRLQLPATSDPLTAVQLPCSGPALATVEVPPATGRGYGHTSVYHSTHTTTYNGQRTQTNDVAFRHAVDSAIAQENIGAATLNQTDCAGVETYTAVELNGFINASALNELGDVAGQIGPQLTNDGRPHAAIWENGQLSDLGMAGCRSFMARCSSAGLGLNNQGIVVGESNISNGNLAPFFNYWAGVWPHETVFSREGPQPFKTIGSYAGFAEDINNKGTRVGSSVSSDPSIGSGDYLQHGFVVIGDASHEIGQHGQPSTAMAVNEKDVVTGQILSEGYNRAYRWDNGVLTVLGHLGGGTSRGKDIVNSADQIVGESTTVEGYLHAAIWKNDTVTDLGTLPDDITSTANALNERGQIVGVSGTRAVLWQQNRIHDLSALLDSVGTLRLVAAIDINNHGEILAKGNDGKFYLLKPKHGSAAKMNTLSEDGAQPD